ncbi:MAG: RNA-binding protein [Thermoplasmata archaeon M11B2D]|nr:MAG: RNA-binding protein [Thermoplasmata archaeon M11B2D]PNX52786.1 MAG: RNA-binding protein [Thermoplasmata archaeon M9B2D]
MKSLDGIMEKIDFKIGEKEKIREDALKASRDIIISCRRGIQQLHRDQISEAEKYIKQASEKLVFLNDITKGHPEIFHAGFVENAAQEFVEICCLSNIMKGASLPDPDVLNVTYSAYLLGLCDVVGELRRGALDFMLEGHTDKANEYLQYMDRIYDAIMSFDYPSSLVPIKKKQDMVRALIEKTRGELVVSSCERRIHDRTHEFHGLLDQVSDERNNRKKKTNDGEEEDIDIDKVW